MSGYNPERVEFIGLHAADWIALPQPAEGRKQLPLACIGLRRNDQSRDFRWNDLSAGVKHVGELVRDLPRTQDSSMPPGRRNGVATRAYLAGLRRIRNFCVPSSTSSRRWLNTVERSVTTPVVRPGLSSVTSSAG